MMNLGLLIILISLFGSISNWLNWQYLNFTLVRFLYYIGTVVHELSHAILAILTGAKVTEFKVFSNQPHILHTKSKIPILGEILISIAPVIGGILFLFLINKYLLGNSFVIPHFYSLQSLYEVPLNIISQINFLSWKSWVMILLFMNVGAMISPSWKDLKNIWPAIIVLLFFSNSFLAYFCLLAIGLIIINIIIQIALIIITKIFKLFV